MKRKVTIVLAVVIMFIVTIPIFAKAAELPVDKKYGAYCEEIGAKYNICPELLEAIIEQESSGNPNAVGVDGDIGLMQVIPKWHRDRMERLGVEDLTDEYGNILVATDYLAELFSEYEDIGTVLMAYNGVSDFQTKGEKAEYTKYAISIMERSKELERKHEEKERFCHRPKLQNQFEKTNSISYFRPILTEFKRKIKL